MQTKLSKQSRAPNRAEKDFLAWCKEQPSIVSGAWGVDVHHCAGSTAKQSVGLQRVHIGHWYCIPLTPEEHWLYHNRKTEFEDRYGEQSDLWLKLVENYPVEIPLEVIQGVIKCRK